MLGILMSDCQSIFPNDYFFPYCEGHGSISVLVILISLHLHNQFFFFQILMAPFQTDFFPLTNETIKFPQKFVCIFIVEEQ